MRNTQKENTQKMIDRVVSYRGLPPIKKGMRCIVDGKSGAIVGGNSGANLNVRFDGWRGSSNCHPYWRMTVFGKTGEIIYQSAQEQKERP